MGYLHLKDVLRFEGFGAGTALVFDGYGADRVLVDGKWTLIENRALQYYRVVDPTDPGNAGTIMVQMAGGNNAQLTAADYSFAAPEPVRFAPVLLSDIAAGNGGMKLVGERFTIRENSANSYFGTGNSVSGAGDVNGDGFDDIVVGFNGSNSAYIVYGSEDGRGELQLEDISTSGHGIRFGGHRIDDPNSLNNRGVSVSGAGDINGDGLDDVIIGDYTNGFWYGGEASVVYGAANGAQRQESTDILAYFEYTGLGNSVSSAGDINGDGIDDILIGASGFYGDIAAYVLYGKAGGLKDLILKNIVDAKDGFGITRDFYNKDGSYNYGSSLAGNSVSSAGDVNNDGIDDIVIGHPGDGVRGGAGGAYVIYGAEGGLGTVELEDIADGRGGFHIIGSPSDNNVGFSVSDAGDVNGDGVADLIVGATSRAFGAAYVVYGKANGPGTVDLVDVAAGRGGFEIVGGAKVGSGGNSVSAAGDVNGDGFADLIIDARGNGAVACVVFGRADGPGAVNLDDIAAGRGGFQISGEPGVALTNVSVAAAGDVNGDGLDDLLVGAGNNSGIYAGDEASGLAYVIYGSPDWHV